MCNARVLTAYESQRRLTRNYLEGARRRRLQYTPSGLWQAWGDLDAAKKVYVGSIAGFVISVSQPHMEGSAATDSSSSFRLSCSSLDPVDSIQIMASSAKFHLTTAVDAALNGMYSQFSRYDRQSPLTSSQGSFHLRTIILDRNCWSMDSLEDPTHQRCALLGMADQARDHRGVCVTPR